MYEAKTKPTAASAADYLAAIADEGRRADCVTLAAMMQRITGCAPRMWGTGIVGFDQYHYKYTSGHEGDSSVVSFASRKNDISIYLLTGYEDEKTRSLLQQLGKHKTGKACLYIKHLADVQLPVLEELITLSVAETRRRCPAQ